MNRSASLVVGFLALVASACGQATGADTGSDTPSDRGSRPAVSDGGADPSGLGGALGPAPGLAVVIEDPELADALDAALGELRDRVATDLDATEEEG